jgi:hypothetical protein
MAGDAAVALDDTISTLPADTTPTTAGAWPACPGRFIERALVSILINKDTTVIIQGITGRRRDPDARRPRLTTKIVAASPAARTRRLRRAGPIVRHTRRYVDARS